MSVIKFPKRPSGKAHYAPQITPYSPSEAALAVEWMGEAGAREAGYLPAATPRATFGRKPKS